MAPLSQQIVPANIWPNITPQNGFNEITGLVIPISGNYYFFLTHHSKPFAY